MADATSTPMKIDATSPYPTKAFQKLPGPGTAFVGGRLVEDGETVQLTESQALAWRDRFKAVDDSQFVMAAENPVKEPAKTAVIAPGAISPAPVATATEPEKKPEAK